MNRVHFENNRVSRNFFWFIWFVYVMVYISKNCFSSAMAVIVSEGVMTKSQTGLITALFYIVYAPLQVFGGLFADRYDPEKLIKIGLLGGAVANLIIYFNQNYYLVLIVWVLNAIVQFAIWPSVFKIASSQIVAKDRKKSVFYLSFSSTAGLLLAYLIAAIVPKWTHNFLLSSIILFASALALHIITPRVEKYMIPDEKVMKESATTPRTEKNSCVRLFLVSGFFILVAFSFIRALVGNSIKTLSPTILMESYENVSPSLGNLLNIFIILAGILGTVMVKFVLYPKIIKSAPVGILIMTAIALLCSVALKFVGQLDIIIILISMCIISAVLTAVVLLASYCTLSFEKFGKSGTAAGVMNAATSMGVIANSYGVTKIAEVYSWSTVADLFLVLLAVSMIMCVVFICFWNNFKKKYFNS